MNIRTDKWIQRLNDAIKTSFRRLEKARKFRVTALQQYATNAIAENGPAKEVPLPLLTVAVNTYSHWLAARNPSVSVHPRRPQLRDAAKRIELALQQVLKEMRFHRVMRDIAKDALFGLAIAKTGVAIGKKMELSDGIYFDAGQPFCARVDLDDWVHDTIARSQEEMDYCGNKYELPLDFVKECGLFKDVDELTPDSPVDYVDGNRKAKTITTSDDNEAALYDVVQLWDIYLPKENVILTMPARQKEGRVLREVAWEGPEGGPYHLLNFDSIPGQILGVPETALIIDLHGLTNILWRKLKRQAERQKTLGVYQQIGTGDAKRVKDASDGDLVGLDTPGGVQEVKLGGPDKSVLAMSEITRDLFNWFAGNLDLLGGLSPSSETARQDAMLLQASSQRMKDLQQEIEGFTTEVLRNIAWFVITDPLADVAYTYEIEGTGIRVHSRFTPEQMEGDFLDYEFDIIPMSMQPNTPVERLQRLGALMQQWILPLAPILQAQGMTIRAQELMKLVADWSDTPELATILDYGAPVQQGAGQGQYVSTKPPNSSREYVRRTEPANKGQQLIQSLLQEQAS